ncbi:MAG: Trimeric GatFAB AmidoTransferase(AdT) complex subunit [Cyphobasidiales sp. Tagirdzhanova-0007]|nr:MAG: Trimeric GatFAB AmidoTransferase(AdT) complex subunit [Cyphobasidiales sp. Tagirdzhanova-0007]
MAYSPVQPLLDGDAVFSQYIASPPKQQLQIRIPPNTPHFTRPMRRELSYDFLSSSPPSPAGSVSSSSMVASASSSSVSSMTSNASFASYMSAGVPNTFPYNIGCHPCSPGHVLSHSPPMQPQGNTLPRTPSPSHQTNSEADITASGKRQRSSSSDIQSHLQSPTKRANASPGKRGSGKDGAEVWPEDVEGAFMEALRVIPKLGRRKVMINGKPCGRNELIADYIRRKTFKVRSRKQVSSHIQVLKNLRRNDVEFMDLVTESMDDTDSFPAALLHAGFGMAQIPCIKTDIAPMDHLQIGLAASPMGLTVNTNIACSGDGLLSPYTPTFLTREASYIPSPPISPAVMEFPMIAPSISAYSLSTSQLSGPNASITASDFFLYNTNMLKCSSKEASSSDPYNALISYLPESSAAGSSSKGRLNSLRVSIKQNFTSSDAPTSCASRTLAGYTSPFDATVVSLLRQHGANIVGKTNMDEFGMGSYGLHSYHGHVSNPLEPSRVAGGSSSGAAASVAAGLCDAAIGSDTGGSVRLPASFTGTIGFKPSYGLLSRFGLVSYASSLDTVGILAARIAVVEDLFEALNAFDARDPTAIPEHYRGGGKRLSDIKHLRIGIPTECFPSELSKESIEHLRRAIQLLRCRLRSSFISVSIPSTTKALSAYYTIASAEASSNLAKYDGVRYGHRAEATTYAQTRSEGFGEEAKRRIILGTYALMADAFDNYFLAAQRLRNELRYEVDAVMRHPNPLRKNPNAHMSGDGVDILLYPSAVSPAPTISEARASASGVFPYVQDILTVPASLAGLPAISFPVPVEKAGERVFPVGVQLVGQWGSDALVLDVAKELERELALSV